MWDPDIKFKCKINVYGHAIVPVVLYIQGKSRVGFECPLKNLFFVGVLGGCSSFEFAFYTHIALAAGSFKVEFLVHEEIYSVLEMGPSSLLRPRMVHDGLGRSRFLLPQKKP